MKIIFLDIDGVCITWRSHFARSDWSKKAWKHLDIVTVNFLCNLCEMSETPLRIVISSSWRFNSESVLKLFKDSKLVNYFHGDWRTTIYENIERKILVPEAEARGGEINEWMKRHPEVKDYRILDDDVDMLPNQFEKFVKCDGFDGLGGRDMKDLMDWARGRKE